MTRKSGLAIGGYDVVAYHKENKTTKGSSANAAKIEGTTYYFAKENAKLLKQILKNTCLKLTDTALGV
jgi:hypothetical protein